MPSFQSWALDLITLSAAANRVLGGVQVGPQASEPDAARSWRHSVGSKRVNARRLDALVLAGIGGKVGTVDGAGVPRSERDGGSRGVVPSSRRGPHVPPAPPRPCACPRFGPTHLRRPRRRPTRFDGDANVQEGYADPRSPTHRGPAATCRAGWSRRLRRWNGLGRRCRDDGARL